MGGTRIRNGRRTATTGGETKIARAYRNIYVLKDIYSSWKRSCMFTGYFYLELGHVHEHVHKAVVKLRGSP